MGQIGARLIRAKGGEGAIGGGSQSRSAPWAARPAGFSGMYAFGIACERSEGTYTRRRGERARTRGRTGSAGRARESRFRR